MAKKTAPTRPTDLPNDPYTRFGRRFVLALADMSEALVEVREAIAQDEGRDATAVAGGLARALLEAGGSMPDNNPNPLRWAVNEAPSPASDPKGFHGVKALAGLVLGALAHGPRDNGTLARAAEHWSTARTKAEGDAATQAASVAEGQARHEKNVAEHHERLAKQKADPLHAKRAAQAQANRVEADQRLFLENRAKREKLAREPHGEGEWVGGDGPDVAGDVGGLVG
jgi:hypothetical protein